MHYQSYALHNWHQMPNFHMIPDALKHEIEVVAHILPFKTNNYVLTQLVNLQNPKEDPIFNLTFPHKEMIPEPLYLQMEQALAANLSKSELQKVIREIRLQLNPNPSGQHHNVPMLRGKPLNGVQHKYRQTVLFFPSKGQTCHAYCTFCFRWPQFSGLSELRFAMHDSRDLAEYLKQHKEVTDVLITGGDPMTMSAKLLAQYIEPLLQEGLEHIQTIRIGTKSLAYWPYRFLSDEDSLDLIKLFKQIMLKGINLSIMAHFNHPVELSTPAVSSAIYRLVSIGVQIRTQSPLLKHINDHPDIWAEMWRRQVNLNCIPYYMFVERDTGAANYFELPLEQCWQIFQKAYQQVSGVCRTVRGPSMSANPGKIQVLGVSEIKGEKVFTLRFLQGRGTHWVARPFWAKYDPDATWFDQLKPAFGEEKYFFEDELEQIILNQHLEMELDLE